MGWLGDSSHRGQGCQAWTAVGLPPRYPLTGGPLLSVMMRDWQSVRGSWCWNVGEKGESFVLELQKVKIKICCFVVNTITTANSYVHVVKKTTPFYFCSKEHQFRQFLGSIFTMFLPNIINSCLALKQGLTKQVCKRLHSIVKILH